MLIVVVTIVVDRNRKSMSMRVCEECGGCVCVGVCIMLLTFYFLRIE